MAARFQTVACTSTRINMYPSTTTIPPVRFPFVIMQQSHNMSISPQTAAAFGSVGQRERLVSLSASRAPLGQWNALTTYARIGMGSFTGLSFLTIGKITSYSKRIEGPEFQTNCRFNYWPEGPTCVWPADYEGDCTMEPVECP